MPQPRTIDLLLAKYSESHLNPTNEVIHFICVPVIVFTLLGLVWAIHPLAAVAVTVASLVYYFTLSKPFALGMLVMAAVMLAVLAAGKFYTRFCRMRPRPLPAAARRGRLR